MKKTTQNLTAKLPPGKQLLNAMLSPFSVSAINLRLNTLFGNSTKQGSFVTSLLHIDAGDLKFTEQPDGSRKAVFDIVAMSFGDNGVVADSVSKTYTLTFSKKDSFQGFLDKGFVYYFTFPVKKPGGYQLRVAVRDTGNDKIGSANQFIEVPNLKKDRLAISGVVLEDFTEEQWKKSEKLPAGTPEANNDSSVQTDPLRDTSLRVFNRGTILSYHCEIYNAKLNASQKPNLTMQIRVFREGQMILDGRQTPVQITGQTDFENIKAGGAINIGNEMTPGDYVMQVIVFDNSAKEKRKVAAQFVPFEITGQRAGKD